MSEPSDVGSKPSDVVSEPSDVGNEPSDVGSEPSDVGSETVRRWEFGHAVCRIWLQLGETRRKWNRCFQANVCLSSVQFLSKNRRDVTVVASPWTVGCDRGNAAALAHVENNSNDQRGQSRIYQRRVQANRVTTS